MGSGVEEWGVGVGEWGVAACIDPPVAGHSMPYPAKAPPPPLSSRIASRAPPTETYLFFSFNDSPGSASISALYLIRFTLAITYRVLGGYISRD